MQHAFATGLLASSVLVLSVAGCIHREQPNSGCKWPSESAARPLDLGTGGDRRHLRRDVAIAEDLAIRHADAERGRRSGRFVSNDEYARTREHCLATLIGAVAETHGVPPASARELLGDRSPAFDAVVMLSFAIVYTIAASFVTRRLIDSALAERGAVAAAASLFVAAALAFAGVLVGALWSAAIEMVQVANGHLSYRAARIPWGHHYFALLCAGMVVAVLTALKHYAARSMDRGSTRRELPSSPA